MKKYWLMKCEPNAYSIDDLEKDGVTDWNGVRNYQARNFMMKEMKVGDLAIYYHSNATPPGAAGIMTICKEAYPDSSARDKKSKYYDPKACDEKPIWYHVDVSFVKKFDRYVSLKEIRETPSLSDMMLLKRGMRLSIQPITKKHFDTISKMGNL